MKQHTLPLQVKWTNKEVVEYLNTCLEERFRDLAIKPFTLKDERLTEERLNEIVSIVSSTATILYNMFNHQVTRSRIQLLNQLSKTPVHPYRYRAENDERPYRFDQRCLNDAIRKENERLEGFFGRMFVEQEGFHAGISHPSEVIRNFAVSLYRKEEKQRIKNLPRAERKLLRQGKA